MIVHDSQPVCKLPSAPNTPADVIGPRHDRQSCPSPSQVAKVAGWLASLIDPDQVVELRALGVNTGAGLHTAAGTFRGQELDVIAREALAISGSAKGVYYTLNPLKPERFTRQAPRMMRAGGRQQTHDRDILTRTRLLVDVDAVKVADGKDRPATDAEHAAALAHAETVREYLTRAGLPDPVFLDSGNGAQLVYRVDLPTDTDLVRRFLRSLATLTDGAGGRVDTSVYNPSRIARLPGPMNCKGEATADRPHRRAVLLATGDGRVASAGLLGEVAGRVPDAETTRSRTSARVGAAVPTTTATSATGTTELTPRLETRARRVLDTIPPAIDGANGSKPTLWAARCLVRGFGFSPADALTLLQRHYNPRCQGPWSDAELARKVNEAATKPFGKPDGWLLAERKKVEPGTAHGYEGITPDEAAELAAEEDPQEVATVMRELLRPDGRCRHPRPIMCRRRSTGLRSAVGFPCGNGRTCPHCRHDRLYERFLETETFILRVTDPKAPDNLREKIAVAVRPDVIDMKHRQEIGRLAERVETNPQPRVEDVRPDLAEHIERQLSDIPHTSERKAADLLARTYRLTVDAALPLLGQWYESRSEDRPDDDALRRKLDLAVERAKHRVGGQYLDCATDDPKGVLSQFGPSTNPPGVNCDNGPAHLVVMSLPESADPPPGFTVVTPAAALRAIGHAFQYAPAPVPAAKYKAVHASHGWGDDLARPVSDLTTEGAAVIPLADIREVVEDLQDVGVEVTEEVVGRAVEAPVGLDTTPGRSLCLSLMFRGVDAPTKPTKERIAPLARLWMRAIPATIGDGPAVASLLRSHLWVGPWRVSKADLEAAHERDVSAAAWHTEAEAIRDSLRPSYWADPGEHRGLLHSLFIGEQQLAG